MENQTPEQHEWLWRGRLSEAERAALRGQPDRELDAELTVALARLPDVQAPSNFTARVLNAIDLDEAQAARRPSGRWAWRVFWPRAAFAATALLLGSVAYDRHEVAVHRMEMAQNLASVASSAAVPSVDALKDLEAIQRMSQSVHADTELLADLQ